MRHEFVRPLYSVLLSTIIRHYKITKSCETPLVMLVLIPLYTINGFRTLWKILKVAKIAQKLMRKNSRVSQALQDHTKHGFPMVSLGKKERKGGRILRSFLFLS